MAGQEEYGSALAQGSELQGSGGSYRIGRVLGQGGFGITYAATYPGGKRVAIKEYFPMHCAQRTDGAGVSPRAGWEEDYAQRLRRFSEEGRTLLALEAIPSVVRALDAFEANGTGYLVMEFLDGLPLYRKAEALGGRIPPEELLPRVKPLLKDLETIHRLGLIHRDITPDNVMWMPDGTLKLIDFGSARAMSSQSKTVLLKQGYAPVEQYITSSEQGPYTDVYALSATIYYLLSGVQPPVATERLDDDGIRSLISLGVALTPEEDAAILPGMAVQPQRRTQSAAELARELYSDAESAGVTDDTPVGPTPPKQSFFRRLLAFFGFGGR